MTKEEKEKYYKKMKQYERLGALKFQKIVFLIEKGKYKLLKKICPNFIKYFDKYCNWKQKKELKHTIGEEEEKKIKNKYKIAKMAMRKEFYEEKNRNYHMNPKRPTEIRGYLEWNKRVHKNGLIKDSIVITILIGLSISGFTPAIPLLISELMSLGINIQCINIQNYNLCRYKIMEDGLKRREESSLQKSVEEYGEVAEVIHKTIEKEEDLPTIDDIIDNIKTKEQLDQLKLLLLRTKKEREEAKINDRGNKK